MCTERKCLLILSVVVWSYVLALYPHRLDRQTHHPLPPEIAKYYVLKCAWLELRR